jgi:hypothetical protein
MTMKGNLDKRFGDADEPLDGETVRKSLAGAEFCTGLGEQKARNLESGNAVAITTGTNTWNDGLDIVVEGPRRPRHRPAGVDGAGGCLPRKIR